MGGRRPIGGGPRDPQVYVYMMAGQQLQAVWRAFAGCYFGRCGHAVEWPGLAQGVVSELALLS